ncbi:MAG: c-type cytochrome [Alphaproteobacteria bacterium]
MSNLESNKIFAAVLVAGIVAMLSGFIAELLVHPHESGTDAVAIEGAPDDAGGAAVAAGPEPILSLIAAADVAQGQKISKACAACHNFEKGAGAKIGPDLWNIVGRAKAHEDFAYSEGMKNAGGNWGYEDLNKFLWKPKAFVADTKMNYIGVKKPEDRAAMIAWLRTLADAPKGLPSEGEIAREAADLAPPKAEEPAVEEVKGSEAVPSTETKPVSPQEAGAPAKNPAAAH